MRERFVRFMAGRYGGNDLLNKTLLVVTFVLLITQIFVPNNTIASLVLSTICWALIIFYTFRMLSKNTYKRSMENYKFHNFVQKTKRMAKGYQDMFNQRKTHKFFRCPGCKNILRVPKGKGKIKVHCRQCGHSFDART